MAGWQSGHAADCKSVYAGSIPASASKFKFLYFLCMYIIHIFFRDLLDENTCNGITRER